MPRPDRPFAPPRAARPRPARPGPALLVALRTLGAAGALLPGAALAAQERQIEAHAAGARSTRTHEGAWGVGAQYQLTWGAGRAPVRLATAVGVDWQRPVHAGPRQASGALDLSLQPGGDARVTPYLGGSVGANWLAGAGAPHGALLGLQGLVGVQVRPTPRAGRCSSSSRRARATCARRSTSGR